MPHFPDWFVAICVLLPVSNVIYKTWKNNKKNSYQRAGHTVTEPMNYEKL